LLYCLSAVYGELIFHQDYSQVSYADVRRVASTLFVFRGLGKLAEVAAGDFRQPLAVGVASLSACWSRLDASPVAQTNASSSATRNDFMPGSFGANRGAAS
jgi:hypothetical protein